MSELLMALCALGFGFGLTMLALGMRGRDPDEQAVFAQRRWRRPTSPVELRRRVASRVGAIAVGTAVWVITGWPVAGLAAGLLVVFLPWLLAAGAVARRRIERLEALEDWLRHLTDIISTGNTGLIAAIQSSARMASPAIAEEIATLAQRLRTMDPQPALLQFADDIDDEIGDAAAAGLCVAYQHGPGVAALLRQLANKVSDEVSGRRQAETERARRRSTGQMLMAMWGLIFIGFSTLGSSTYTSAYDTVLGQLVLAVVFGLVGMSAAWLRQLGVEPPSPRFLVANDGKAAAT